MIRTQVYFPEDLFREMKLYSQMASVKVSSVVRQATRDYINKKIKVSTKSTWKNFIGAYKGNVKSNAVNVFHDYYRSKKV